MRCYFYRSIVVAALLLGGCAAKQTIVGQWEAVAPSQDFMGSEYRQVIAFYPDGTYNGGNGMLMGKYTILDKNHVKIQFDGKRLVNGIMVDFPPTQIRQFSFDGNVLILDGTRYQIITEK